jgi:hypothetical protein
MYFSYAGSLSRHCAAGEAREGIQAVPGTEALLHAAQVEGGPYQNIFLH